MTARQARQTLAVLGFLALMSWSPPAALVLAVLVALLAVGVFLIRTDR